MLCHFVIRPISTGVICSADCTKMLPRTMLPPACPRRILFHAATWVRKRPLQWDAHEWLLSFARRGRGSPQTTASVFLPSDWWTRSRLWYCLKSASFRSRSWTFQKRMWSKYSRRIVSISRSMKGCDIGVYGTVLISSTPRNLKLACHCWYRKSGSLSKLWEVHFAIQASPYCFAGYSLKQRPRKVHNPPILHSSYRWFHHRDVSTMNRRRLSPGPEYI